MLWNRNRFFAHTHGIYRRNSVRKKKSTRAIKFHPRNKIKLKSHRILVMLTESIREYVLHIPLCHVSFDIIDGLKMSNLYRFN